ncbi:MAG: DGQHR domain-containing protein [Candidatus Heimdallarchaeota archaeon]|nr:DGQHR domain-containing protein [Candidatus Heimdallarchaeota archaeon]
MKNIPDKNKPLKIPVQKISQPIGDFFIASLDARELAEISYSDVREMRREVERYLGIQRPLNKKRVKEIRNYILNTKDATFPTAVILAIDEKCAEYNEEENILYVHPYSSLKGEDEKDIPYHKIAKVLDGQHRIAGFFSGEGEERAYDFDRDFEINVSIFVGIALPEQAKIFATVNLAQTKVNKSLVYDLEDLARKRNPYKSCHHIAVALDANNGSPFFERIKRLGVATPGRDYEPLTQATFVETLVKFISDDPIRDRNDILDGKRLQDVDLEKHPFNKLFKEGKEGDIKIYKIIYNYFKAVEKKWPNAWAAKQRTGNLLPKSNAFKALMKYLKEDVYIYLVEGNIGAVPDVEQFYSKFERVQLTDDDFTTKNFVPGGAGQSTFYKVLIGQIEPSELYD